MFGKKDISKYYELVKNERAPEVYSVRIKKGKFKDVVYCYGRVSFNEEESAGNLGLSFEYFTLDKPLRCDVQSRKFRNLIGDILVHLLSEEGVYEEEVGMTEENILDDSRQI